MASAAHLMFNAFAKEVILVAKRYCAPDDKSVIKKHFKLFDASSPRYADEYVQRVFHVRDQCQISTALAKDSMILPRITVDALTSNIPDADVASAECAMRGMAVGACLVHDQCSTPVTFDIIQAILHQSTDNIRNTVLDEDLMDAIEKLAETGVSEDLRVALSRIPMVAKSGAASNSDAAGVGIMQLAQEVSEGLDLSGLMSAGTEEGAGDAAMSALFETINRKVMQRMQDGSIDPSKLAAEASSILGSRAFSKNA